MSIINGCMEYVKWIQFTCYYYIYIFDMCRGGRFELVTFVSLDVVPVDLANSWERLHATILITVCML
jgi:hypothetical protein